MTAWRRTWAFLAALTFALGAVAGQQPAAASDNPLRITRFLGEQTLPHKMPYEGTVVGGLSGIDYDPLTSTWYLISDDRWRYNPARFYTGQLDISPLTGAFTGVRLTGVTTLLRPDGTPYPGYGLPEAADPETIRFDPWSRRLLWGNEGDRPDETHPGIPLSDQFIRWTDASGYYLGELPLPASLRLTSTHNGPRRNSGIEGLAFARNSIAAMVEGPRYEDGEPPTAQTGAPARITVWSRSGHVRGQYAYLLDRLPVAPTPPGGASDSGVSEILAIDEHRYLALERSWIEGADYRVRLYEIDLRGATNVLHRDSLYEQRYRPVAKRLVLDLGTVARPQQNYESLSWGPRLVTGECSLVIGSDDNFYAPETTQFLAFAVKGC